MTFEEALALLEPLNHVAPGRFAKDRLDLVKGRSFSLSDLPRPFDGSCFWCNARPILGRKKKYCSDDCAASALRYCYPQAPDAKAYVLVQLQKGFCTACGVSHEKEIVRLIESRLRHNQDVLRNVKPEHRSAFERVSYHQLGYGTGQLWHVDHRDPIHKGGRGIGLENIQVICVRCHLSKTAQENRRA